MYVNQSIGQHTLSLFKGASHQQPAVAQPASLQIAKQRAFTASEPSETTQFRVSDAILRSPKTASEREFAREVKLYTDTARAAKLNAASAASQAEADAFQLENGYRNRMTVGLEIAHGMASRQEPGEAHFETRADAIEALVGSISNLVSAGRWVNRSRDVVLVPSEREQPNLSRAEGDFLRTHTWSARAPDEAEDILSGLPDGLKDAALERREHDLKVSSMKYDVYAAELSRDFGVRLSTSTTKDAEGRVVLNDLEIVSSVYGKLGEIKNGELNLYMEDRVDVISWRPW